MTASISPRADRKQSILKSTPKSPKHNYIISYHPLSAKHKNYLFIYLLDDSYPTDNKEL